MEEIKYIPPHIVTEIMEHADIVSVVSEYVELKRKGGNYWAKTPFGKEKTASFSVNPSKGIFKCFSSGYGGNVVSFLMHIEGYTPKEALIYLAKKHNIEIPHSKAPIDKSLEMEGIYRALNQAQVFFENRGPAFEQFISERGISPETVVKFGIGISPNGWNGLYDYLIGKFHSSEILQAAGLCKKKEKWYDVFRNKIMFPVHNSIGKIVGFGGRVLNKEEPKYLNSKESPVYEKNKLLYGLFQAKTAIKRCGFSYLVEGYMDTAIMHQFGYENTVASAGTGLTVEQIRLLRRFTNKIVLIYDGDSPGIKAALRAVDLIISEGMEVSVLILPDNHDPDSYLRKYGNIDIEPYSFIDFRLKYGGDSIIDKKKVVYELAKSISFIDDKIEVQLYAQNIAQKTGIDYSSIMDIVNKNQPKSVDLSHVNSAVQSKELSVNEIESTERMIVEVILHHGDTIVTDKDDNSIYLYDLILERIKAFTFFNHTYESIRADYSEGKRIDYFYQHPNDRVKMAVMELNTVSKAVELMLSGYDSFDMQWAWYGIAQKLCEAYISEWHQKVYTDTIKSIRINQDPMEYIRIVKPLLVVTNNSFLKKYEL